MSYEIIYSQGSITVEDRDEDFESTSLTYTGRYRTDYGEPIAQNFLSLLENFATSEPQNPIPGQLWYDTSGDGTLKIYDGDNWCESSRIKRAQTETETENNIAGDLWVNTNTNQVYVYSGTEWILVGPSSVNDGSSGFEVSQIEGTDNQIYTVLVMNINNITAAIVSFNEFTPRTLIVGFTSIKKGVNLSSRVFSNANLKYWGTSEKAESLVVDGTQVPSRNFLRGDRTSTTDFQLNVRSNDGITIGGGNKRTTFGISGSNTVFSTNSPQVQLQFTEGSTIPIPFTFDSSGRFGIGTSTLNNELEVIGDANVTGSLTVDTVEAASGFTGSLTGNADTATLANEASSLESARQFNITGALSASDSFDGTGDVTLNVVPQTSLISNRPQQTVPNNSDEVLIRRGTALGRMSRGDLLQDVPPTGSIVAYPGSSAPDGWLFCDGSAYNTTTFSELFSLLGTPTTPDFTGTGLAAEAGISYIIYTGVRT